MVSNPPSYHKEDIKTEEKEPGMPTSVAQGPRTAAVPVVAPVKKLSWMKSITRPEKWILDKVERDKHFPFTMDSNGGKFMSYIPLS